MEGITDVWKWISDPENQKAIIGMIAFISLLSGVISALFIKIVNDYKKALDTVTNHVEEQEVREKYKNTTPNGTKSVKKRIDKANMPVKIRKVIEKSVDRAREKNLDLVNRLKGNPE